MIRASVAGLRMTAIGVTAALMPSAIAAKETSLQLSQFPRPATTVKEWVAQVEAATVQVTGVRIEPTEGSVRLILETSAGLKQLPTQQSEGNTLVAEIENAVLTLPEGNRFEVNKPAEGIRAIGVIQASPTRVQIRITGEAAVPFVQVTPSAAGLILSAEADEEAAEEEITVTGQGEEGYRVPNTSVGTRTDTPLRDIPASIQVVPRQVLEEQQVNTFNEALRNVPGVVQSVPDYQPAFTGVTIRGFLAGEGQNFTRNGLNSPFTDGTAIFSNIERVEVLKGPASVLFGGGNPGGTINIVTKQPLRNPFYSVEATIGSYNLYGGAIDLTGPLNDSKTILYRLNASYESGSSFVDFTERRIPAVAGVVKFEIGRNTDLTLDLEYSKTNQGYSPGLPAIGTVLPNPNGEIPRDRNIGDEAGEYSPETFRVGYNLEHRFNENWSLRNAFYFSDFYYKIRNAYYALGLEPDLRTLERGFNSDDFRSQSFDLITNIVGKFSTGAIQHQLLFGVDLRRVDQSSFSFGTLRGTPIDLFNPVYSLERLDQTPSSESTTLTNSLGIYLQNQVTLTNHLKLLLGGRFDAFEQRDRNLTDATEAFQSGNAFSPRLGIVYQPIQPISLYASYSRSFTPTIGRSRNDEPFEPGRGIQYEIGVKADINDKLSTTLALYDLTRTNVTTADPDNPNFEIQTGEQNSRGVELFVSGEILPGWNVIAGYAYTDARITKDNTFSVGNLINNVPSHSFNLWSSYEIQKGSLKGLGFSLGFFYVSDRQGDLDNSFTLPNYFRTDASIFYKRDRFRAALNFKNLFNVDYFATASGDLSVFPGEPFTVQGTVSWQF